MIKPEDFYRDTTRSLSEIRDKIDENQKETNGKIADLSEKVSVHIAVSKTLDAQDEKSETNSNRKQYFITSLIVGGGLGAFTIVSQFFT